MERNLELDLGICTTSTKPVQTYAREPYKYSKEEVYEGYLNESLNYHRAKRHPYTFLQISQELGHTFATTIDVRLLFEGKIDRYFQERRVRSPFYRTGPSLLAQAQRYLLNDHKGKMSFVDSHYPELSMLLSDEDKTEFNKLIQMYATKTAFVGSKRAKVKKEK